MLMALFRQYWRFIVLGSACYLVIPWAKAPEWQLTALWQSEQEVADAFKPLLKFYKKHGDEVLPALQAQLELNKLRDYERELIAENAEFSDQSRDEQWATASEFVIAHVATDVSKNELRIYDAECRNNLCQIEIAAPKGLTKELSQLILTFASTLKAGDLEFNQLLEEGDRIVLEVKAGKRLKYNFIDEWLLKPNAREEWLAEVGAWLKKQK
jgi:hypothetical protein